MMNQDQIKVVVQAKMAELGVSTKADANSPRLSSSEAGKLIGALMRDLKGKADGNEVKAVVDNLLQ